MKKLLHERLREWVESDPAGNKLMFSSDRKELFTRFADEIDRYYIPRPRFEDGEPLQWGEMVDWYEKPIDGINLFDDGSGRVGNHQDNILSWVPFNKVKTSSLKRPSTKVLDHDGVEIKVGDTVWNIDDPKKSATVAEIKKGIADPDTLFVRCTDEYGNTAFNKIPICITHKEPDSLDKVAYDLKEWVECGGWSSDIREISDRLSALIQKED